MVQMVDEWVSASFHLPVPVFDGLWHLYFCRVYLFHELPADVRARAAAEMARVCKPGGLVVLTDSCQLGDRLAYDPTLGRFGDFAEPYYVSGIKGNALLAQGRAAALSACSWLNSLTPVVCSATTFRQISVLCLRLQGSVAAPRWYQGEIWCLKIMRPASHHSHRYRRTACPCCL